MCVAEVQPLGVEGRAEDPVAIRQPEEEEPDHLRHVLREVQPLERDRGEEKREREGRTPSLPGSGLDVGSVSELTQMRTS